jgi:uncharacterized protein (DUF1778 family)
LCGKKKYKMAAKRRREMELKQVTTKRVLTKRKAEVSTYRLTRSDRQLMIEACLFLGESRSEFLRVAVRQRALKVLSGDQDIKTV